MIYPSHRSQRLGHHVKLQAANESNDGLHVDGIGHLGGSSV